MTTPTDIAGTPPGTGRIHLELDLGVRPCEADDLRALEWYGLFSAHREIIAAVFAAQIRGEALMLLADLRGFPAAQAWLDFEKRRDEDVAVLWALRVFPVLRGVGLGTRLVRAAEGHVAVRGLRGIEIGVEKGNRRALRLYRRLGYAPCGEVAERYAFTTPEGRHVEAEADQWLLRKAV